MSQIASFYLLKDGRRQELSNGDCSGAVYMAIWDWCESELDLDVRFPAPPPSHRFRSCAIRNLRRVAASGSCPTFTPGRAVLSAPP